jgi:signal transduction histidine kinase
MEKSAKQCLYILVVETRLDDPPSLRDILPAKVAQIRAARDLKQAFVFLEEFRFDLVIAGPGLDEADCNRLLRRTRSCQPSALAIVCPNGESTVGREGSSTSTARIETFLSRILELEGAGILVRREEEELSQGDVASRKAATESACSSHERGDPVLQGNTGVHPKNVPLTEEAIAHVAHKLRTPLVAIRGYVRMLLQGRAGDLNDTQREYLTIVADNADRLVESVQEIV